MDYDGLQKLIDDHNAVRDLFDMYWSEDITFEDREVIKNNIIQALSIHDTIERLHLYPLVERVFGAKYADQYRDEHEELGQTLYFIDHLSVAHPEHDELMAKAFDQVTQHMEEEEGQLFAALRDAVEEGNLDGEELQELGFKLDMERNNAPTHPHPGAPMDPSELRDFGAKVLPADQALDDLRLFEL